MLSSIQGGLIVSCQALEHEPLHDPYIMSRMAYAAYLGGAVGIRANSRIDIESIKKEIQLPVIGIVKRDYADSEVFITATQKEIDELLLSGCEMIALDSTFRPRPIGVSIEKLVAHVRNTSPATQLMADISTVEEAILAQTLGFDCVSTTLYGYTSETAGSKLYEDDFQFLKAVIAHVNIPVIAEGNVMTPEMFKRCLQLGAYAAVVGGAITRPVEITKRFVDMIDSP